jgi:hypothetical protein
MILPIKAMVHFSSASFGWVYGGSYAKASEKRNKTMGNI